MSLAALKIPFYPAHPSNYTKGRNQPITDFTVHHQAGTATTLRYLWGDPNRNASSTYGAYEGYLEQYVPVSDTPWTNGNFASNSRSITVEVIGDWRNGRTWPKALAQLKILMKAALREMPNLRLTFHQDVSDSPTACPAELRGHATRVWNEAKKELAAEKAPTPSPTPAPSAIKYEKITPRNVRLKWAANLWDFNFKEWSKAKSVQLYQKGHQIRAVAIATNTLGGRYYMTEFSYNNSGKSKVPFKTNGFNVADCENVTPPAPNPPAAPQYTVNKQINGYVTAADAAARRNSNSKVPAGTYAIFNQAQGMINVTRQAGRAGWWINPADNGGTTIGQSGNNYTLGSATAGYRTSLDARNRRNSNSTVPAGTYRITNQANGATHIVRTNGTGGWWINP